MLRVPLPPAHAGHAFYKFYAFVRSAELAAGWSRDRIMAELNEARRALHGRLVQRDLPEKAFTDRGWGPAARLPVARELGDTSLMFMVHPTLPREALEATVAAMRR